MKLAIEPKGVDLFVEQHKYTKEDSVLMSKIIQHYNKTGELLKLNKPISKQKSKRKLVTNS
ncbi:MAG: hypothetical protein IPO62_13435 [Saprospiraceae bacterium]|nr:hypothetical protein [Saprospiraceae bacterium]MBK9632043.1 hypothetical protein [Saprospiraceae bacterium]